MTGSRMFRLGEVMSIFALRTREPSGNSPFFMRTNRSALDLFGVHPAAPASRFDAMGLFLLIGGGEVIALTASSATIRRRSGAVLTYRRSDRGEAVLMSKVRS